MARTKPRPAGRGVGRHSPTLAGPASPKPTARANRRRSVARDAESRAARAEPVAQHIATERRDLVRALHPVVRMLGNVVGHHVEVVLHDLTRPERSVIAIANGHVSDRRVGSSILSGPKDDQGFRAAKRSIAASGDSNHEVVDGYATLTRGGQRLKSSTVVFRDRNGDPFAALCLNADHTIIEAAHAWLGRLIHPVGDAPQPASDAPDMDSLTKEIITEAVRHLGKPVNMMNREERISAVHTMMNRGLFIVKGGVERAASALGVTRFTIYNYLEALRVRDAGAVAGSPVAPARRESAS